MRFNQRISTAPQSGHLLRLVAVLCALSSCGIFLSGCGKPETRVQEGNRLQILHRGNGAEPQELDPHIATGVPEHFIISSLFEGLVSEDPHDLHPVPGVAERWEVSSDGTIYTFHFRANARWSNGEPVTAHDFVRSYKRMLSPTLASEYDNKGKLMDFLQVGCKAINDSTLRVELNGPTPYFLALLNHYSWYPVHLPSVEKHGYIDKRGNRWTLPGSFVGNGPFVLSEWTPLHRVVVKRSPTYWDHDKVRLNEIRKSAPSAPASFT
jgi:oligopeptide transport system substrate-binding protein